MVKWQDRGGFCMSVDQKKESTLVKDKRVGSPAIQRKWVLKEVPKVLKKPKVLSKKEKCPLIKPNQIRVGKDKKSKVQWYIMHYEEVKTKDQPFHKGHIIARLDVINTTSGIIMQNVAQVRFETGHVFMLPTYRQQLVRDGRKKDLPYLRFQKQKHSDMFQFAMEDLVAELIKNNPERFNAERCSPQIPAVTKQRCLLFVAECRERARLKAENLPQPARKDLDLRIEI